MKELFIEEIKEESWKSINSDTDIYMHDFIDFINNEIAPHITTEGLKKLKKEYASWYKV